ncbi:MAG: acylphosphatase [Lachnospiraceae bacterium]|nr:acylphosphatase [Lachnospiraceae bacterium]MBQ6994821.1 acylphosphatase [Lachnospiraceae bacterium]
MSDMAIVRKHMRFTGRVQGVGFRYRAKYAANGVGITGWVRNEWDGSVELEVQGTEEQINHMLVMINRSDYIVIDNIESKQIPLEEHEAGFHVR